MIKLCVFIILGTIILAQTNALNLVVQQASVNRVHEKKVAEVVPEPNVLLADDLCGKLNCPVGEQCVFNDNVPSCECVERCEAPEDKRLMICTSSNETFDSECHYNREKCWCLRNDPKCSDRKVLTDTLDYYGECKHIDSCTAEQKKVFPTRIKMWLDDVLFILNERQDSEAKKFSTLVDLAHKMKKDKVEKYWTCGVAFKFCQLDKSHDGIIESDELKALTAPIKALEGCIQPFLDECDTNKDKQLSDVEWAKCLDLSDDDLRLLRKTCKV